MCPTCPRKPLVDNCREPRERCILVDRVPRCAKRRNAGPATPLPRAAWHRWAPPGAPPATPPPLDLPRLPTWVPQKRGTAVPGWMFFGAILLIHSPKRGTAVPVTWEAGVGPGGGGGRAEPMGTNRAPMATATPNSFPGGVVADSSGVIDPSAPASICPQPVGGVLGGVVAHSTATTLGVTADDPRGRQSPSEQDFSLWQFFSRLAWWCGRPRATATVPPTWCKRRFFLWVREVLVLVTLGSGVSVCLSCLFWTAKDMCMRRGRQARTKNRLEKRRGLPQLRKLGPLAGGSSTTARQPARAPAHRLPLRRRLAAPHRAGIAAARLAPFTPPPLL